MATTQFASLSMQNQFSFKCPIFDAEVQMRSCVMLRDRVFMGKATPTRRGCQACIKSSKCPAAEMVRRIAFGASDATDYCASDVPKVGRLPGDVLDRIAAVVVQDSHLREHSVTAEEQALIANSRARIDAQALTAPREKVEGKTIRSSSSEPTPRRKITDNPAPKVKSQPSINEAAATGNLAAALNAA